MVKTEADDIKPDNTLVSMIAASQQLFLWERKGGQRK